MNHLRLSTLSMENWQVLHDAGWHMRPRRLHPQIREPVITPLLLTIGFSRREDIKLDDETISPDRVDNEKDPDA